MNFNVFTDAVKSFQALDEMAANDTYVNSEGLNVNKTHEMERKNKKKTTTTSNSSTISETKPEMTEGQSVSVPSKSITMEQHYMDSSQSSSLSSSLHTQNDAVSTNHDTNNLSSVSTPQSYMLDSVAQILNNPGYSIKKKTTQKTFTSINSTVPKHDSPGMESEDNDPILKMMNEKEKMHILESSVDDDEHDDTNIPHKTKKDPNRFLMDLDARMSVEIQDQTSHQVLNSSGEYRGDKDQVFNVSKKVMAFQSFSRLSQSVASWIGISQKDSTHSQDPYTSASTSSEREALTHSQSNHDEEIGVKVSSSAFLGDAEAAELLQIQHRNSDIIFIMKRFLEERNKKHFLYLGIFVLLYLWTRGR